MSTPERVYCTQCGKPARSGAKFCAGCGAPLYYAASHPSEMTESGKTPTVPGPTRAERAHRPRSRRLIYALSAVALLLAIVGITAGVLATRDASPMGPGTTIAARTTEAPSQGTTLSTTDVRASTTTSAVGVTTTSSAYAGSTSETASSPTAGTGAHATPASSPTTSLPSSTTSTSTSAVPRLTTTTISASATLGVDLTPGPWSSSDFPGLAGSAAEMSYESGAQPETAGWHSGDQHDTSTVWQALRNMLSRIRAGDPTGASACVTADFFKENYSLFFADSAPTIKGVVLPRKSIAVGPRIQISAFLLWLGTMTRSTVVFSGAVNSSGEAVLYDCRLWPSEKY